MENTDAINHQDINNLKLSCNIDFDSVKINLTYLLNERKKVAINTVNNDMDRTSKELFDYINEKIKLLLALP
jgi:Holliday junction resolvase RusA-like endonuclease